MDGFTIRDYASGDLEACLAVFDSDVPEFFVPAERPDFRAFLGALPGPYHVVVDEEGIVVGCGGWALVPAAARADICWDMIRRDLQGHGLGRLLTRVRLDAILADPTVEVVALNTSQLTTAFYERFGFVVTERIADGYAPGLHRCEMRMTR